MHPRNVYRTPPDFNELATKYPEFLKISKLDINGKVKIDFKEQQSLRVLTRCLLLKDFSLDVEIPPDRLVPTVPLRLNYLLWLEDLLQAASITNNVTGIDVGTGACCIYPLLAATKFNWKMIATEIDENSVNMARKNVRQNKLQDCITVKKVDNYTDLLKHCFQQYDGVLDYADFCMCNPPFYASAEDMDFSRTPTREPPSNARTGTLKEIVTEGGEIEFVKKMVKESLHLKDKIKIYTTMLGRKSSLKPLLKIIKESGITQVCQTNFVQGKTMRWGLAWSFVQSTNLCKSKPNHKQNPNTNCMMFEIPALTGLEYKVKDISYKLFEIFKQIDLEYKVLQSKDVICTMEVKAKKNTWSHQRRKKREEKQNVFNNQSGQETSQIKNRSQDDYNNVETERSIINISNSNVSENDETISSPTTGTKRKLCQEEQDTQSKRSKTITNTSDGDDLNIVETFENSNNPSCSNSSEVGYFLTMAVCVRINDNVIVLEVGYVGGPAGKDGVHQVVQYLKNNWR